MNKRLLFIGYCLFAIIISYIPFVGLPFIYLGTVFHEMSHALVAILTGGHMLEFSLSPNGSGYVRTSGSILFLTAFSGYFGVTIWAMLLFQVGHKKNLTRITLATLIFIFAMILILWVKSLMTGVILGLVIGMLVVILLKTSMKLITYLTQAMAILILFNAIKSPLYLIDGRDIGDGAALAEMTFLPEIFWVSIWCGWGICVLYFLFRSTSPKQE